MLNVLGIILGILISSLWIFLPRKRVPEEIRIPKKTYILSILVGATLCTAVIILLETVWDKLSGIPANQPSTMLQAAAVSFLRAALLEEGAKYWFVRRALKKHRPKDKLQYMLLAATIGMGYGITEKLVMGSAVAMLADAAFAMHTMFQFLTGWYLYQADQAEEKAEIAACRWKAILLPFFLHGCWDFIQFGGNLFLDADDMNVAGVVSLLVMAAAVIVAVIAEIKTALYFKRMPCNTLDDGKR